MAALLFVTAAMDAHAEKHGGEPGFNMATYLLPDHGTGAWVIDPKTTWRHEDWPSHVAPRLGMRRLDDDGPVVPLPISAEEFLVSGGLDTDGQRVVIARLIAPPFGPLVYLDIYGTRDIIEAFDEFQRMEQEEAPRVSITPSMPSPQQVTVHQVDGAWVIDTMMQGIRGPSGSLVAINPPEPEENALYYDFALVKGGGCVFTMVWRNTLSVWYHSLGSGMSPKGAVYAPDYTPLEPVWSRWAVFNWPWEVAPHQILTISGSELALLRRNDQLMTFALPSDVEKSHFVPLIDIRDSKLGLTEYQIENESWTAFDNAIMHGGPEALLGTERQKGPEREEVLPAPVERILKIVGEGKTLLRLADGTTLAIERDATEPRTARSEEISLWESIAAKNKPE